jgi:DNA-binding transcriptional LysR family regulator
VPTSTQRAPPRASGLMPARRMSVILVERPIAANAVARSSGRAQLTPNGRAIVEWSSRIIDDMKGLLEGAAALRSEVKGQLHVGASMTVAEYLVPEWLIRLRTTDPDLRVSLEMGNSELVIALVRWGRAEIGFVAVPAALASRLATARPDHGTTIRGELEPLTDH